MVSDNPKFSVVTPTRNRPHLLKRCMSSISRQTFSNYEHIIIDDGSDDDTKEIIDENRSDHLIYFRHENSRGVAASYNTGLKNTKGEFIIFLDDDDEAMPSLLEKLNDEFSSKGKNVGFIITGIDKVVDRETGIEKESVVIWPEKFSSREQAMIAASSVGNVGVCIRKECFDKVGFYDEKICFAEDTDLIFRMLRSYEFSAIKDILVRKHKHSYSQLTSNENYSTRIRGIEIILQRYKDMIESLPNLHSVHHSSYAYLCYKSHMRRKGRKAMLEVIKRNPGRLKSYPDLVSLEMFGTHAGGTILGVLFKKMKAVSI
ncbi:MAG TPA: glycosyltransferase family 2 protein [Bacteroidales bacterium]|nr:glycosyltransferase family 2 protein [Bacteroidales bacterium]